MTLKTLSEKIPGFKTVVVTSLSTFAFCLVTVAFFYFRARHEEETLLKVFEEKIKAETSKQGDTEAAAFGPEFNADAHRRLAVFFMGKKQYAQAIPHFEKVADPENIVFLENNREFCMLLVEAYLQVRMPEKANYLVRRLKEAFGEDADLAQASGEAKFLQGDPAGAEEDLFRALKMEGAHVKSLVTLGRVYANSGRPRAEVAATFHRALALDSLDPQANYYFGVFLSDGGEYREAVTALERVLRQEPFHSPALSRLGTVFYYLGNYQEARKKYELVISINPTDYNTLYNLGELYLTGFQNSGEAYGWFRKSWERNNSHFFSAKKLGVIALNNRNYKEACQWFEKAGDIRREAKSTLPPGEVDHEFVSVCIFHATALEALHRREDAMERLRMAIHENPSNPIARHKLRLLESNG